LGRQTCHIVVELRHRQRRDRYRASDDLLKIVGIAARAVEHRTARGCAGAHVPTSKGEPDRGGCPGPVRSITGYWFRRLPPEEGKDRLRCGVGLRHRRD
jgi:hypothetical protein